MLLVTRLDHFGPLLGLFLASWTSKMSKIFRTRMKRVGGARPRTRSPGSLPGIQDPVVIEVLVHSLEEHRGALGSRVIEEVTVGLPEVSREATVAQVDAAPLAKGRGTGSAGEPM